MKKFISLILALLWTASAVIAQQDTVTYEHRPFQFTFLFPPLSTNGLQNARIVNDFSLNLFVGVSGGVEAFEAGGFINIDNYYVHGVQLAGFANVTGGELVGAQSAGFANFAGRGVTGFQGAGFMNVAGLDATGFQGAGFMNVAGLNVTGFQGAGFMNVAGLNVTGFQGAGFMNLAGAGMDGIQAAGFINVSGGRMEGFQGAGFINVAGDVEGVQAAGFINVAGKVKGAQLAGFINICDSIEGIPLAFINVVRKNGFRKFGFSLSEVQYANIFYKMGVAHFYNIYSFGKPFGPGTRWMYGGGLGTLIDLQGSRMLNIEGTVHQELWIAEPDAPRFLYIDRLNLYNSVKFLLGWELAERAEVHLGPTFNLAVSNTGGDRGILEYHGIAPYSLIDWTRNNSNQTNVQFWVGLQGSISF